MRTTLRGRADELDAIGARLALLSDGTGGLIVVEGDGGSGKSRMLDEAARLAADLGLRVLRGGAEAATQERPFSLLLSALGAPPEPLLDRAASASSWRPRARAGGSCRRSRTGSNAKQHDGPW
jgi:hypothetical protein